MTDKPTITWDEFGRDGNIFFVAAAVRNAYKRAGRLEEYTPIGEAMRQSSSYAEALQVLSDAVTFVDDVDDDDDY